MNRIEYILIINFNSKEEALAYIQESGLSFSFSVLNVEIFNSIGELIEAPLEYNSFNVDEISLSNASDPLPGELYIEDGFLKYYKEI